MKNMLSALLAFGWAVIPMSALTTIPVSASASQPGFAPNPASLPASGRETQAPKKGLPRKGSASPNYVLTRFYCSPTNGGKIVFSVTNGLKKSLALITESNAVVTFMATPSTGFKFTGWSVTDGGPLITTNARYTFTALGDTTLYANFADVQAPTVGVLSPVAGQRVSGRTLAMNGRAHDNGGIAAVYGRVAPGSSQDFTWFPVQTQNQWATWSARTLLFPGTNEVAAYAVDLAGNCSKTNYVKVFSTAVGMIPETLEGLSATETPDGGAMLWESFGAGTFAREASNTNLNTGVGNCAYVVTRTNTAQFSILYVAPSLMAGTTDTVNLTFTGPSIARFSSGLLGSGTLTLTPVGTVAPKALPGTVLNYDGAVSWTNYDGYMRTDGSWSYYAYARFSPVAGLLAQFWPPPFADSMDNHLLTFSTTGWGHYFETDAADETAGLFLTGTFASRAGPAMPNELAPASLTGMEMQLTLEKPGRYALNFGDATFGAVALDRGTAGGVADYFYTRTGSRTAQVLFSYVLPTWTATPVGALELFYTNSQAGYYFNTNGFEAGTFQLAPVSSTAPVSLAGKVVNLVAAGDRSSFIFGQGTYRQTLDGQDCCVGTYTLLRGSPQVVTVGLTIQKYFPPFDFAGALDFLPARTFLGSAFISLLELKFSSASSGAGYYFTSDGVDPTTSLSDGSFLSPASGSFGTFTVSTAHP